MAADSLVPLARSPLWQLNRIYHAERGPAAWSSGELPDYISSNPYLAHAYARVALTFLRERAALGHEGPDLLVELGAGSGRFGFHFLRALLPAWRAEFGEERRLRYIMTDACAALLPAWQEHPSLKPFVEQGCLDFARCDVTQDTRLELLESGETIELTEQQTPIFIANYLLHCLPADAWRVRGHRLQTGLVQWRTSEDNAPLSSEQLLERARARPEAPFSGLELQLEGQPLEGDACEDAGWQALLEEATSLPACELLFPRAALESLRALSPESGCLWLLADRGRCGFRGQLLPADLRLARHGTVSLPVNFHALAGGLGNNARVWLDEAARELVCGAIVCGEVAEQLPRTHQAVQRALLEASPDAFFQTKKAWEKQVVRLDPRQMLGCLRLARYDAAVLRVFAERLRFVLADAPRDAKELWGQALEKVWQGWFPDGSGKDLAFECAELCRAMQRYAQAVQFYQRSLEACGEDAACLFNQAFAHWQLGEFAQARASLEHSQAADPLDGAARLAAREMARWQRRCEGLAWYGALEAPAEGVALQPLGELHADALRRGLADEACAAGSGFPVLASKGEATRWIGALLKDPGRTGLAIVHAEYGAVGALQLQTHAGVALLSFWLAADFRGYGHGGEALTQLVQLAPAMQLAQLFVVLPLDGVLGSGFNRLETMAARDDEPCQLWVHGSAELAGLRNLLEHAETGIELPPAEA